MRIYDFYGDSIQLFGYSQLIVNNFKIKLTATWYTFFTCAVFFYATVAEFACVTFTCVANAWTWLFTISIT